MKKILFITCQCFHNSVLFAQSVTFDQTKQYGSFSDNQTYISFAKSTAVDDNGNVYTKSIFNTSPKVFSVPSSIKN